MYIQRNIQSELLAALSTSPVVLVHGARQTGKSTLAQHVAKEIGYLYVTLDDLTVLGGAQSDPSGFLSRYNHPLIIDEIQKAPKLLPAIKLQVDRNRQAGQYLLTGSANVLMLPKLSESLVGRMEIIPLRPLSVDELVGTKSPFIDAIFAGNLAIGSDYSCSRERLVGLILAGGYPEIQKLTDPSRRDAWFRSYIETILQRDIRDISQMNGLFELHRLLALTAAWNGTLLNMSSMARDTGLVLMTLKRYLAILEAAFLIHRVPAWFRNIGKSLIKAPKLYLNDTGLLAHLTGCSPERLRNAPQFFGRMLEGFIIQELIKQASWSRTHPSIHYYRTIHGKEIDIILENRAGEIVAIEVKSAASVGTDDFRAIRELQSFLGRQFIQGIVLYPGDQVVPFGEKLTAMPVGALWAKQ